MNSFDYNPDNTLWYIYIDYEKRLPYYVDQSGINIIMCRDYKAAQNAWSIVPHVTSWKFVIDIPVSALGLRVVTYLRDLEHFRPYRVRIHTDPVETIEKRNIIENFIDILETHDYGVEVYNSYNGEPITI